jgi:Flp pilus assembly pilin Flp
MALSFVRRLLRDTRGAVNVEYLLVAGFVGIVTAVAIMSVIPRVKAHYENRTIMLSQPYP